MDRHASWIEWLATQHRQRGLLLLFDFDGTLSPIVENAHEAFLADGMHHILSTLSGQTGFTLGVLSGRALDDLKSRLTLSEVFLAGSVGMHLDLAGEEVRDPSIAQFEALVPQLSHALSDRLAEYPGTWVEWKPGCCSVHYRSLSPSRMERFRRLICGTLRDRLDQQFLIRDVTRTMEITLRNSWTKSDAILRFRRKAKTSTMVMYAGDSDNDADAMALVNALGGLTLGIGAEAPTQAKARLESPQQLTTFLTTLCSVGIFQ